MSRSGYSDDLGDTWDHIRWRGAVASAINGFRGQCFLQELRRALDALPEKRLIAHELQDKYDSNTVCAIGAVGRMRGVDMSMIDPEDSERVSGVFGIAEAMAKEIEYENDEGAGYWSKETPEQRYSRMREWVESRIKKP